MNKNCSVVVLFETEAGRQQAIQALDQLVAREWCEHGFATGWSSLAELKDPGMGAEMAAKARAADIVIFAVDAAEDFDLGTLGWIERWIGQCDRQREGALVGLVTNGPNYCTDKEVFLRNVAAKAGLDYLTRLPDRIMGSSVIPDSLNSFSERACQRTGVLDEILRHAGKLPRATRVDG